MLARKRSARPDAKTQAAYAAALARFSESAVRRACEEIEASGIGQYEARWPELSRLEALCRRFEPRADTSWTLARYREAWYIDRVISERVLNGERREAVLADINSKWPTLGPMWAAWRTQTDASTIHIPAAWCERCEGQGTIPMYGPSVNPNVRTPICLRMRPCPSCRRTA